MSQPHNCKSLSQSQNEALNKAWELLCEHFDSCIIAYETESSESTTRVLSWNYHGGIVRAIGLAEYVKNEAFADLSVSKPEDME